MDRSGQPRISASSTRVNSKPLKSCGPRTASGYRTDPPVPSQEGWQNFIVSALFPHFHWDCDHLWTEQTDDVWSFLPTLGLLSVWFCLHLPLSQMSQWSVKCFHTTDEFNQGPFDPGPGPAVSVTPACLANIKAGGSGRMEVDLNLRSRLRLLLRRKDLFPPDETVCQHV